MEDHNLFLERFIDQLANVQISNFIKLSSVLKDNFPVKQTSEGIEQLIKINKKGDLIKQKLQS